MLPFIKKIFFILIVVTLGAGVSYPQKAATASATPSISPKDATTSAKAGLVLPPEKAQPVRVPKFDKAPLIDGKLDDEVWQHAAVLKDFYQIQPGDNIPPSKPTEVLLG